MASKQVTKEEWDSIPWKTKIEHVYSRELTTVESELCTKADRLSGELWKFKIVSVFWDANIDRYVGVYTWRGK